MESQAKQIIDQLIKEYFVDRNIDGVLSIVDEKIIWVSAYNEEMIQGKKNLHSYLEKEFEKHPDHSQIDIKTCHLQKIRDDDMEIFIEGIRSSSQKKKSHDLRITLRCLYDHQWYLQSVHISFPTMTSENRLLTKELNDTRMEQQFLLDSIPGGIALYRLKADGRVTTDFVSEGLAKICGYTQNEFLQLLKDDALQNVVAEDIEKVMAVVKSSLEQNVPISVAYRIYDKNKKEVMIRLDANFIENQDMQNDDVASIYAVHTKISDDQRQVIIEQERYRQILKNLDVAFFEWTENSFMNSKQLESYAFSDYNYKDIISNKGAKGLIKEEDMPVLMDFLSQDRSREDNHSATIRCLMKDGTYHWTEISAYPEYDEDHHLIKAVGVFQDMNSDWIAQNNKLQKALDEAKKASQAKTDFLSRVSHDMRTPLNGMLGITKLLQDDEKDPSHIKDLKQLELSGRYLLNLINDTLDVSRIENGKLELHPIVCDGQTVFHNVLSLLKPNLDEKKICLNVKANELPFTMLYIDVGRVEQIVMNILSNSIKFSPPGSTIEFTMVNEKIEDGIIYDRVIVEDHGIGMSKEYLPHLFEPFSQEHNDTKSTHQGTGLGMSITKQIIELMGGSIHVESEKGVGTTFSFTLQLPIASDQQVEQWNSQQKDYKNITSLKGKRILLCEDHPLNAEIAIRFLKKRGMIVDHAANGEVGYQMYLDNQEKYDAILMDIRMPVMDGIETTKAIRQSQQGDSLTIPIIAMSANALSEDILKAKEVGMTDYLAKPVDIHLLYQTLEHYIQ